MIRIRSFTQTFARYAEVNPVDRAVVVKNETLPSEVVCKLQGVFDLLNDKALAVFNTNGTDLLLYDGELCEIDADDYFECTRINSDSCKLTLQTFGGRIKFELVYLCAKYGDIDRIGWTEEESDYNFGLWLDKQSRKRPRELW